MTATNTLGLAATILPGELKLQNLVKYYGNNPMPAVDGVSLTVRAGEMVTLLGPSGCGKTTTLRMIAGFESVTSGDILLDEDSIVSIEPNKRPMSMVFQSYALFPHLTVRQNVAFGLKLKKIKGAQLTEEVDAAPEKMPDAQELHCFREAGEPPTGILVSEAKMEIALDIQMLE